MSGGASLIWPDNPYGWSSPPGLAQCNFDIARGMGYKSNRWVGDWTAVDTSGSFPSDPSTWSWGQLDADVQLSYANQSNFTLVLATVPSWGQYLPPGSNCSKARVSPDYALFVTQTVLNRYNGGQVSAAAIARLQLANEGFDDSGFGDPCDSFENFAPVLVEVYPWVKNNYPVVQVSTAAHFNREQTDIQTVQQSLYTGQYANAAGYFDASDYHWYGTVNITATPGGYGGPDGPQNNNKATFNQEWQLIHAVDVANGNGNVPVICSETGMSVPGSDGVNTEAEKALYWITVLNDMCNSAGVLSHVFLWTIANSNGFSPTQGCGSITYRPAYAAIQNFIQQHPTGQPLHRGGGFHREARAYGRSRNRL